MSARKGESGYALVVAAVAIVLLAVASTLIVHASAGSRIATIYEVEQAQAALTSQAGVEWVVGVAKTGWGAFMTRSFPSDGGSMSVERTGFKNRAVRSTGRRGSGVRVSIAEFALLYVPGSRQLETNADVVFELFNLTGSDVDLTGWKLDYATPTPSDFAFYEEVRLSVFSSTTTTTPNSIDYGTVWSYTIGGGGSRAGSGTTIAWNQTARIPNNRQALVTIRGFKAGPGGGASRDMDARDFRMTPREGAAFLAGVGIDAVTP